MSAVPSGAAPGVYKPRRPQASPLFRLVSDHFCAFHHAYEERFAERYGDWRPVVREVADKFLLGDLARVAARTVTTAVRALTGEPALAVGIGGLHPDARLARELAPAHSYDCDGRRLSGGWHVRAVARARHGRVDGGLPPRRAPALRVTG
jgi:hypothetical protein